MQILRIAIRLLAISLCFPATTFGDQHHIKDFLRDEEGAIIKVSGLKARHYQNRAENLCCMQNEGQTEESCKKMSAQEKYNLPVRLPSIRELLMHYGATIVEVEDYDGTRGFARMSTKDRNGQVDEFYYHLPSGSCTTPGLCQNQNDEQRWMLSASWSTNADFDRISLIFDGTKVFSRLEYKFLAPNGVLCSYGDSLAVN